MDKKPPQVMEVFPGLPVSKLLEYTGAQSVRNFKTRELVFQPKRDDESIFFVQEGKIRLYMTDIGGKEFTINVLAPGDIFSGHTRCFGEALTDVRVIVMNRTLFRTLVAQHPEIGIRLIPVLGNSLKNAFDIIEGLVFKACNNRLAWFLLGEAEVRGIPTPEGITVTMNLTTEQIATRIGATRQTTSTLLNDMARQGIFRRDRNTLVIRDLERLRRISAALDEI